MWDQIITIKITTDLNYFSPWEVHLFNTQVSQFELNYWNELVHDILIYWEAPVYLIRKNILLFVLTVLTTHFCLIGNHLIVYN